MIVVALQYFNACHVLLCQHKPPDQSLSGFEAVKVRRNNEVRAVDDTTRSLEWTLKVPQRDLITALGNVIGLAESNAWVENANFTAHHMLRTSILFSPSFPSRGRMF